MIAREPAPGDVWIAQRPLHAAARTCPTSRSSRRWTSTARSLGYAVTRAHHSDVGGMRPGSMPADSREIYQEGLIIPPVRLVRDGESTSARADPAPTCARPTCAAATCARRSPANRLAERAARASWSSGAGRDGRRAGVRRGARLRRAAHARGAARAARRHATRPSARDRGRRRHRRRHPDPRSRSTVDGDALDDRLRRHRRPGRRQRQLPARGHALGLLLRAAGAAARRRAGQRRHLRGARASTRPRARSSTRSRPPPWSPATSRPRSAIADTVLRRARAGGRPPGRRARAR